MAAHPPGETISGREVTRPLPAHLARVMKTRFPGESRAAFLAGAFLALDHYDRRFAAELVSLGRGRGGASWNFRLLSAMMLADQCLRLTADAVVELTFLFGSLGLLAPGARMVNADVLRQGYTSAALPVFSAEFLRHLNRLERIHRRLRGFRTTAEAWDDFIVLSAIPAKRLSRGICSRRRKWWSASFDSCKSRRACPRHWKSPAKTRRNGIGRTFPLMKMKSCACSPRMRAFIGVANGLPPRSIGSWRSLSAPSPAW